VSRECPGEKPTSAFPCPAGYSMPKSARYAHRRPRPRAARGIAVKGEDVPESSGSNYREQAQGLPLD